MSKESRSGYPHQRIDFPEQDDANWLCHVDVFDGGGGEIRTAKRPLNRRLPSGGVL